MRIEQLEKEGYKVVKSISVSLNGVDDVLRKLNNCKHLLLLRKGKVQYMSWTNNSDLYAAEFMEPILLT